MNKENIQASLEEEAEGLVSVFLPSERTYLATTPQLTPEIVEKLLEHLVDPVNGSNAKGRKPIGMCCLHVDDLFITGTPEFLEKFKKVVKSQFKIGHENINDLMFTGQRVKWVIDEKTKRKSHIVVEQSLCVGELTGVVIPQGSKDEDKCDKELHTACRSLLGAALRMAWRHFFVAGAAAGVEFPAQHKWAVVGPSSPAQGADVPTRAVLLWPPGEEEEQHMIQTFILMRRQGGLLVVLPENVLEDATLRYYSEVVHEGEEPLVGPYRAFSVPLLITGDGGLLEPSSKNMSLARMEEVLTSFLEDGGDLDLMNHFVDSDPNARPCFPDLTALVQEWISTELTDRLAFYPAQEEEVQESPQNNRPRRAMPGLLPRPPKHQELQRLLQSDPQWQHWRPSWRRC
eukprot:s3094_g17.t1